MEHIDGYSLALGATIASVVWLTVAWRVVGVLKKQVNAIANELEKWKRR
jgi:hypothetical protein